MSSSTFCENYDLKARLNNLSLVEARRNNKMNYDLTGIINNTGSEIKRLEQKLNTIFV